MSSRPLRHKPADSLADIIENAERIEGYLAGMDRAALGADGRTRDAVERCVERVCEAVYRLADRAEALMPGHSWGDIRGAGNRRRHAYDRISLDVIWAAARHDLPALAAARGKPWSAFSVTGRTAAMPAERAVAFVACHRIKRIDRAAPGWGWMLSTRPGPATLRGTPARCC